MRQSIETNGSKSARSTGKFRHPKGMASRRAQPIEIIGREWRYFSKSLIFNALNATLLRLILRPAVRRQKLGWAGAVHPCIIADTSEHPNALSKIYRVRGHAREGKARLLFEALRAGVRRSFRWTQAVGPAAADIDVRDASAREGPITRSRQEILRKSGLVAGLRGIGSEPTAPPIKAEPTAQEYDDDDDQ